MSVSNVCLLESVRVAASLSRLGVRPASDLFRDLERRVWLRVDRGEELAPPDLLASSAMLCSLAQPNPFAGVAETDLAATRFERCYCVGPAFARNWVAAGFRTVDDVLRADQIEQSIPIKERKLNLSSARRLGMIHRADIEQYIHREECDRWSVELRNVAQSLGFEGEVLGSYRRGKQLSSDVDFVARHPDYVNGKPDSSLIATIVDRLSAGGVWRVGLASGPNVHRGLGQLIPGSPLRRLDISLAPYDSYAARTLSSTGDTRLMKIMRTAAIKRGMLLNENGLWRTNELVPTPTEQDIFAQLSIPYLEPADRCWPRYRRALFLVNA